MDSLARLGLAASAWFLIHPLIAGSALRPWLVGRAGERGFRAGFALLSALSRGFLIHAYRYAPCSPLWIAPKALLYVPALVVPGALVLFAGSFLVHNPTVVGRESALDRPDPARGVLRITRHPFLWGVALWSLAHLIVNGSVASQLFFGSMLLTALAGTRDIDRKRLRSNREGYERYLRVTSNVPFAAVLTGRNHLVLRELLPALAVGGALSALLFTFHRALFHVSPVP